MTPQSVAEDIDSLVEVLQELRHLVASQETFDFSKFSPIVMLLDVAMSVMDHLSLLGAYKRRRVESMDC